MTMEITDVVQVGITSMIHMRAVNTKIAMVLCITGVRPSIPKNEVGTAHRKIVSARTIPSAIQFFFESLVLPIFLNDIVFFSSFCSPEIGKSKSGYDVPYAPPGSDYNHTSVICPYFGVEDGRVEQEYESKA